MGYSLRVPLPGGRLKIKSKGRLRPREVERKVPVVNLFGVYLIWESKDQNPTDRRGAPMF